MNILGAAYGKPLGDTPEPGRMAPADTIPVSPELADALSEAAQLDETKWCNSGPYTPDQTDGTSYWCTRLVGHDGLHCHNLTEVVVTWGDADVPFGEPEPAPLRLAILDDARAAISGDRDTTYGGPEDSFTRIAGLWEAQFGYHFDAGMVAQAMILLKCARLSYNPTHRDSFVDIAGYAACGAEAA